MRLLQVTWRDAISNHSGWARRADVEKQQCPVVRSVGWELKRTKRHLTLVASVIDGDDDVSCDVSIPLGMIIKEQELVLK